MQITRFKTPTLFCWIALVLLAVSCQESVQNPEPVVPLPKTACAPSVDSGYTENSSYLPGETIQAFLQSKENIDPCRLDIYDLNGNVVFSVPATLKVQQTATKEPSIDGFGYSYATEIKIPTTTRSGIYLIEKKIPVIVRAAQPADITIVYPSNTANAYALSGGRSLYENKASMVSFQRPIELQWQAATGLKWFSSQSEWSINYIADSDLDRYEAIQSSKLIILVGHSEYWTRQARVNFDRFVDDGHHAIILSGNTMWWQVRYSPLLQLICYRSMSPHSEEDPIGDPLLNTIEWDQPSLQYPILPSIGADFPHGGYGLNTDQGWDGYQIVSPQSPLLEGLNLQKGDIISLPSGEYDGAPIAGFTDEGYPILDNSQLNFHRIELIGFDRGTRKETETIGTFIVFQKTPTSGIVVNGASYDWCSFRGMGGTSGDQLKAITRNAIRKLLNREQVFSN